MASINLSWTAPTPAPVNGYRIKYWRTDTPGSVMTVTPNPTTNSHTITGLGAGVAYSGTIEASCAGGNYSSPASWSVTVTNTGGGGNEGGGSGGGTEPTIYYYTASKFDCTQSCTMFGATGEFIVKSTTALTTGKYYKTGTLALRIEATTSDTNWNYDLTNVTPADTCSEACGVEYYRYNVGRCQDCDGAPAQGYIYNYTTVTSTEVLNNVFDEAIVYINSNYYILHVADGYTTVSYPDTNHMPDGNLTSYYLTCNNAQGCTSGGGGPQGPINL